MESFSKKRVYMLMGVSIFCLGLLILTVSYAYFKPIISGEGSSINVFAGKVKLSISESKITATNVVPIKDTSKDTKAEKNEFSISRTDESNLAACYSLYLVVDNIGDNLKSEYFKYELSYTDKDSAIKTASGNFGNFTNFNVDAEGNATIGLLINQELSDDNPTNDYVLRLWLSYDENVDQTSILTGDAASKTFEAHVYASGVTGTCKVTN